LPLVSQTNEDSVLITAIEDALKAHPVHPYNRIAILASLTGYAAGLSRMQFPLLMEIIEKNIQIGLKAGIETSEQGTH
jgi:hypothetical protein